MICGAVGWEDIEAYGHAQAKWFHEVLEFLFRRRHLKNGPTLENFWGAPQDAEEESSAPEPAAASAILWEPHGDHRTAIGV